MSGNGNLGVIITGPFLRLLRDNMDEVVNADGANQNRSMLLYSSVSIALCHKTEILPL